MMIIIIIIIITIIIIAIIIIITTIIIIITTIILIILNNNNNNPTYSVHLRHSFDKLLSLFFCGILKFQVLHVNLFKYFSKKLFFNK